MTEQDKDRKYLVGITRRTAVLIAVAAGAALISAVVTVAIAALLVNIFGRMREAEQPYFRVVEVDDNTTDPAVWGKNFPQQYDMYLRTVDMVRTRYGGSEALPFTPPEGDPRSVVARSRLEEDPRFKIMWAGYPFAADYREARGHAYMLEDQTYTLRQQVAQQPGTCVHCHASTYVTYKQLGDGDIMRGFEVLNQMPYQEARKLVEHPVSCIDCHEPDTMQLRITRPAFIEGIQALKRSQGISLYDVNRDATRQEMRAFVCGQCHCEYYFQGPEKRLVYPWANGLKGDEELAYYLQTGFTDWTHAETGARVIKAQHPEFEMWNQGIHSQSGVACADCHMPYIRVGGLKVSDHHVRSPLLNINNACQTCHKFTEQELMERAELIQTRTIEMRDRAMDALVALIGAIKSARDAGATDDQLAEARSWQMKGQFLIDYVFSENSSGFHASQEAARILMQALDFVRQGQVSLLAPRQEAQPQPSAAS